MNNLNEIINMIFKEEIIKIVLSNLANKYYKYIKIKIAYIGESYQITQYTEKQVFHKKIIKKDLPNYILGIIQNYKQLNAWDYNFEYIVKTAKSGKILYSKIALANPQKYFKKTHNREKDYILKEGTIIEPLIDMGIFTKDGKVINSMYDKYRQINRFIEIINDSIKNKNYEFLNIVDFGCGKSYLTFILYYFLSEIKGIKTKITGLDLKADVIGSCNNAAKKYNYSGLKFIHGDIKDYKNDSPIDMVITLHACDTSTDYALFNAINWKTKMIFSVPCCQHELNQQISSEKFKIITRYGIAKEKIASLYTDIIRCNLLSVMSYNVQLLEFIDSSHTPKNLLIRADLTRKNNFIKKKILNETVNLMTEFNLSPTLYNLLIEDNLLKDIEYQ